MKRRRSVDTLTPDEVLARFENWRQSRRGKQRIPEELWSAAIELARRNGVNPTATATSPGWRKAETANDSSRLGIG